MFHIELRQFPHSAWRFNLSEAELRAVVVPWAREQWVEVGERKWNPHEAKLTILEGPKLETQQLSMGRGWRAAQRRSEDITERVLTTVTQAEQERARAQEDARIEEAARAQVAAAAGSEPVAQEGSAVASPAEAPALADPLALGVQLAALLGAQPAQLLAAWQQAAAGSPGLSPSETLALAERALASSGADTR
jgi:hypothetical protein